LNAWPAPGDLLADPAEPDDADSGAGELGGQRIVALQPAAVAHIPLRLRDAAAECQHQPERQLRHRVVQHLRGVANLHAVLLAGDGVNGDIADAEAGDHLQRRRRLQHRPRTAVVAVGSHAADPLTDLGQECRLVLGLPVAVHGVGALQRRFDMGHHRAHLQDVGLHLGGGPSVLGWLRPSRPCIDRIRAAAQ